MSQGMHCSFQPSSFTSLPTPHYVKYANGARPPLLTQGCIIAHRPERMRAGVGGSDGVGRTDVHRGESDEDGRSARGEERGGAEDRDGNDLREMISSHPLYEKLVRIHLDCLKAGGVGNLEVTTPLQQHGSREPDRNLPQHISDLDQFMESYCLVVSKLREAMEEPQAEATSFINGMHSRLDEIVNSLAGERPPRSSTSHSSIE